MVSTVTHSVSMEVSPTSYFHNCSAFPFFPLNYSVIFSLILEVSPAGDTGTYWLCLHQKGLQRQKDW